MVSTVDSVQKSNSSFSVNDEVTNHKIRRQLENWQFKNIGFASILNIAVALWLTWLNYGHTYQLSLLEVWFGVMVVANLLNIVLSLSYYHRNNLIGDAHGWLIVSRIAIFSVSCAWCSMAFLVTPVNISQQYFLLFVYAIVISAFTIGEITDFISALISVLTLLLPIILWPLFRDYFSPNTLGNAALNVNVTIILEIYGVMLLFMSYVGSGFVKHYIYQGVMLEDMNQALAYQASHDSLTGVANRNLLDEVFEEAVAHARNNNTTIAVLFLDLDNFKNVNDTLGHEKGDKLLQYLADRLKQNVREGDWIVRLGGDEFIVLLNNIINVSEVTVIAERILQHLNSTIQIDGAELQISSSMGISFYPKDARDVDELIRLADTALYQAKANGKGVIQYYK